MDPPSPDDSTIGLSGTGRVRAQWRREIRHVPVPALTLLCHPDIRRVGEQVQLTELLSGREALLSRHRPEFRAPRSLSGSPLADPYLSRRPLRFQPLPDGALRLVLTDSRTPVILRGERLTADRIFTPDDLSGGIVLALADRVALVLHDCEGASGTGEQDYGLVGASDGIQAVRNDIGRVADLDISILLRGETGTGKELAAKAIHLAGPRREGPFVAVNLGSLTPTLAGAELFGYKKGAFTGAVQDHDGYFRRAQGGTLLLDEIGEAPAEIQVMLLRAIETREILPVGSPKAVQVDVRFIAATDCDLEGKADRGEFREPLLHRLSDFVIWLPTLRHRRDDIGRLFVHFLREESDRLGALDALALWEGTTGLCRCMARLAEHGWPGNVRQLRNVVRQLVVASRGLRELRITPQVERILAERAPRERDAEPALVEDRSAEQRRKPSEVGCDELRTALKTHRWHVKAAAAGLGISRPSLYSLIDRCPNVRKAVDLRPEEIRACWAECGGDLDAMVDRLEISKPALKRRLHGLGLG